MRLKRIRIKNYRSITDSGNVSLEPLQAFVGENNAGKSNILRAISCFLSSGAGGMKVSDFKDISSYANIECEFGDLNDAEKRKLRPYLLGDKVILSKFLRVERDENKGKTSIECEYHGYRAEPREEHLSIVKIEKGHGPRPRWSDFAEKAGIVKYVQDENGRINKTSYKKGLERYILENNVKYDEPVLGETQALGIPQNLLSSLPKFYLLPAITDYSDEVNRRSSSTVFRRLMSDLAGRVMRTDPRYQELDDALETVRALLNKAPSDDITPRLNTLSTVENSLRDLVRKLMPSVNSISIDVEVEASQDLFSKGVNIKIDDGVLTDVLDKGHGMQRSMVFSLLQMLITSVHSDEEGASSQSIILAIEEPELYIHPHSQRLIFRVLKEFAGLSDEGNPRGSDQVIYTTHSASFVDVASYDRIGMVRKPNLATGTLVKQAPIGTLEGDDERKTFKILTSFGLEHNEVFFGQYAIIVEGPEDGVGVIATARKLGKIDELLDELGITVLVAGGKGDIPKFQKILNAFQIDYGVLLEMDGKDDTHKQNAPILENLGRGKLSRVSDTVEKLIGHETHFQDQREAKDFFSDSDNINQEFMDVVKDLFPPD